LGKNVKILAQLQEIDLKIDASQLEVGALQAEAELLAARAEEMQQGIAVQQAELEAVAGEKQALEENLAVETEAISRSESRLREIKTQKEYQAVSKEVATAKKVKDELEEQVLQKIAGIEELKASVDLKESELRAFEETAAAQKDELQAKIAQLETVIAADNAVRETTAGGITPSMMKRYATLRERRQGVAIVEARSGSCLGCNMNLPPQLFNSLFKADSLITCPHCQRILFLRQEENTAV
jgi:uncharacterized protein